MGNLRKYVVAAILLLMAAPALVAQNGYVRYYKGQAYHSPGETLTVDWKPEYKEGQRYTIALRPFYLANNGLKLDFEFELGKPGRWLQVGLVGRYTEAFDIEGYYDYNYGWNDGWTLMESDWQEFHAMRGGGLTLAYKAMQGHRGWYLSFGAGLNYYDVDHIISSMVEFQEDGLTYYKHGKEKTNTKYYKPQVNVNIGKHFAISKHLFLDAFLGIGYVDRIVTGYEYPDYDLFTGNAFSFGHTGLYPSGGFRIGWLWGGK